MGDPCLQEPLSSTVLLTVGASGSQGYSWSLLDLIFRISSAPLAKSCTFCGPQLTPGLEDVCIWSRGRTGCSPTRREGGMSGTAHPASPDVSTGPLQPPGPPPSAPAEQRRLAARVALVRLGSRMTARLLSSLPARASFALSTPSVWSFEFQAECPLKQKASTTTHSACVVSQAPATVL